MKIFTIFNRSDREVVRFLLKRVLNFIKKQFRKENT